MLWTQKEIDFLKEFYPIYGSEYISEKLGKSCNSIRRKASTIGLKFKRMKDYKICKVDGCDKKVQARGMCSSHYNQARNHGEFSIVGCKNQNCNNSAIINGFCSKCYTEDRYEKNKNTILERNNKWRANNEEHMRNYWRNYGAKDKKRDYQKQYRLENKEKLTLQNKISRRKRTIEYQSKAFDIYDNQCQNCGNDDLLVLEWHHRGFSESNRRNGKITESGAKIARIIVLNGGKIENIMLLCSCCHIKQNIIDGTCKNGTRMLRISQGIIKYDLDAVLEKAFNIYGRECQRCNKNDASVLQWHHRNGDRIGKPSGKLFRRIRDANRILNDIMLLCANCHIHQDLEDGTSIRGTISINIQQLEKVCQ